MLGSGSEGSHFLILHTECIKKMYTKLIKPNLKLITLICDDMWPFSDSTQSDLNSVPSFVGICQVLGEMWLFEHKFQVRKFGQL